jgi:methionine-rich copper-binding protein CopC
LRPRTAPTMRATAVATACAVGLLVAVGTVPASAHASLVRSSPADRSSVATAPRTVSLTFDENLRMPSVILVTDADGASVVNGKTSVVDNVVSTPVRPGAAGALTVVYRVLSADGHPVSGRLFFTVGSGSPGGERSDNGATAAAAHHHESGSSGSPTRVVAMLAALALVGGVGLLTVRRWAPNLWSSS